jgi:hypothetical protein
MRMYWNKRKRGSERDDNYLEYKSIQSKISISSRHHKKIVYLVSISQYMGYLRILRGWGTEILPFMVPNVSDRHLNFLPNDWNFLIYIEIIKSCKWNSWIGRGTRNGGNRRNIQRPG